MSLILNALNKAEKERQPETSVTQPIFNPLGAKGGGPPSGGGLKKKLPFPILLVISVGFLGMVGFFGIHLLKNRMGPKTTPQVSQPSFPVPEQPPPKNPNLIKEEALKSYQEGNFEASRQSWKKLIELTPTDAEAYNNLGVVSKKLGRKEEAREAYRTALGLNPNYPETMNNLGVVLLENLMTEEAEQLFVKAIELNPRYAEPYFHLALILEEKKEIEGALEKYQTFLNLSKDLDLEIRNRIEMRIVSLQNF